MQLVRREPRSPPLAWLHSGDMAGPLFDAVERAQLSDLFDELGPQAPTLLTPWTTRDLAAHLVLRYAAQVLSFSGRGPLKPSGHGGGNLLPAHVEMSGPAAALEAVRRARFGM
jgi:hypothetical protein